MNTQQLAQGLGTINTENKERHESRREKVVRKKEVGRSGELRGQSGVDVITECYIHG